MNQWVTSDLQTATSCASLGGEGVEQAITRPQAAIPATSSSHGHSSALTATRRSKPKTALAASFSSGYFARSTKMGPNIRRKRSRFCKAKSK